MPRTTLVAGTTITASWANANVRDQVVTPFASASARDSAITAPIEGQYAHLTDTNLLTHYNGTVWAPANNNIIARQSITSNSTGFTADATSDFVLNSVVVYATRLYRVHLKARWVIDAAGVWAIVFTVDGVSTEVAHYLDETAAHRDTFASSFLWEPTSGTKNLDIRVDEISGTSTLTFEADSVNIRRFWVEDIGPR